MRRKRRGRTRETENISKTFEISYECLFYVGIYNRFFLVDTNLLRHVSLVQN